MSLPHIPVAVRACALLAFLNAACWSVITPPFLGVDEPDHFAYVQQLAESRRLPSPSSALTGYSPEEILALQDLRDFQVRFRPEGHLISSSAEQRALERDLARSQARRGRGDVGVAAPEPPLYYALQTIPYALGSSGSILARLQLMRSLSALLAAVTALFIYLFLREALPAARWAWTVGGLGAALAPLLGYASSTVNPDALLFAVCAALFYCMARAFRRGLAPWTAAAIGGLIAAGSMTKLNFLGLAPGALLGLLMLARRAGRTSGRRIYYRSLAPALILAASPGALYALINLLTGHPALDFISNGITRLTGEPQSIPGELSYIWQFYLPRLPGMRDYFGPIFTTRQIWFRDLVGLYGWSDVPFPAWVYDVALIPAALVLALCIRGLACRRAALRERLAELAVYASMTLGALLVVGASGYLVFPQKVAEFTAARYLLPLLVLWGAVLALAARGAGRRWGPIVGTLLVVLVFAHDVFSQLQVIARYYG